MSPTLTQGDSIPSLSTVGYAPVGGHGSEPFSLSIGASTDYACFALWSGARTKEGEILRDLRERFEVVGDFEIEWSKRNYNRNISRLYENSGGLEEFRGWNQKVGPVPFRLVVVRDLSPSYTWKRSVSGMVEPSNEKVVAAKYRYRDLFSQKYQVHSSNNIEEFFFQGALLLGPDRLATLFERSSCREERLAQDLEGAEGWKSWEHLFSVLNLATRYVVLRNFDDLPGRLGDSDIDFLCDNFQRLASAANVHQSESRPFKGRILVAGEAISADLRYTGDGYYPALWQKDMLTRRVLGRGFYVPAADDLFFSLLYHCKVHKPEVRPNYEEQIDRLAQALRFDWYHRDDVNNDAACRKILAGYLRAKNLSYEEPVDPGVYCNEKIIRFLPQRFGAPSPPATPAPLEARVRQAVREPAKILPYTLRRLRALASKI